MAQLLDLARCYVASTGTGPITLGSAVPGYLSVAVAGGVVGKTYSYAIRDGANSEIGRGVWDGTTLTRSVVKSTSSDTPINVTTNAQIFITPLAEDLSGAIGPWQYWRIRARSADPASGPIIQNLQLRGSVGGSGITPASLTASSGTAANAVNGTGWQASSAATVNGNLGTFTLGDAEQVLTISFASPQNVAEIALQSAANSRNSLAYFDVFVSNDSTTWYALTGFVCNIGTTAVQTFSVPTVNIGGVSAGATSGSSGSGSGATHLFELIDVNVAEGAGIDQYYLKWDQASSKWVAAAISTSSGATALSALTDVSVTETSLTASHVLAYNGGTSKWEAATALGVLFGTNYHKYWKVVIQNNTSFVGSSELKLEATAGAGTPTPVTYSSDSNPAAPAAWYDGDETHYAEVYTPTIPTPVDLIFTFTTPQYITNFRMHTSQSYGTDVPNYYAVYWSDDGITWTLARSQNLTGIGLDTTYNYAIPDTTAKLSLTNCGLGDFPTSYSGKASQVVRVNSAATALEFKALGIADLADVNVSEGAGLDGLFLKWDQTTGKWIGGAASGSGGVPANMELGPYKPPTSTWFDRTHVSTGLTTTLTDVAGKGLQFNIAGGSGSATQLLLRSVSGWGTSWTVKARIVHGDRCGTNPTLGVCIFDSSTGKFISSCADSNSTYFDVIVQRRNTVDSWNANTKISTVYDIPTWFQISLSGTTVTYSFSWDGLNFFAYSESSTAFLSGITHAGLSLVIGAGNTVWGLPAGTSGLITYYSDPDYSTGAVNLQAA